MKRDEPPGTGCTPQIKQGKNHTWFVIKLLNTKDKEKVLKPPREKDRMTANFSTAKINIRVLRENTPWPDLYPEAGKRILATQEA